MSAPASAAVRGLPARLRNSLSRREWRAIAGMAGCIVLLVPRIGVSAALAEGPAKDAELIATHRQMADETGVDITVRQCVGARSRRR